MRLVGALTIVGAAGVVAILRAAWLDRAREDAEWRDAVNRMS
jgi:hypothetical protein